jgi:hypothetical protein
VTLLEALDRCERMRPRHRSAGIAGKAFQLAVMVGIWSSCPSGAEVLRVDRVELEVPDGGMTLSSPPASIATFRHRVFDLTLRVEVEGAKYFTSWKTSCTPARIEGEATAPYLTGTLARTDAYVYSRISRDSHYGISTPKGSWLQYCLTFQSGELAARVTVDLPKSALERGEITTAEIERVLAGARLVPASVEDRATGDPRIVLEMPADFVPTGLPTFSFRLEHNRLPLHIGIALSGPEMYEKAKLSRGASAMPWKDGNLARTDAYLYRFVSSSKYSSFELVFAGQDLTAQIAAGISQSSLDRGDVTREQIERMLAGARISPATSGQK